MSTPVHPLAFQRMTPHQRRLLAERRRREVQAAASQPRTLMHQLIAAIESVMAPVPPPTCTLGCDEPVRAAGLCARCYWREYYQRRRSSADMVDEVVVQRVAAGDQVESSRAEWLAALRHLVERGLSDADIAKRLRVTARTILRWRKSCGIESRWVA